MPPELRVRVAVRVFERRLHGRELILQERKDLHFAVEAKHEGKAKQAARRLFEERNPALLWMSGSYVSPQELRVTAALRPPPKKHRDPVFIPGTGAQYTTAGRRR